MLGTFFLIDYFCFISCFFRGFSVLWIEKKKSFVFSFCLTFSIAMKSLKTVTYSCLERVSSCQNVSNSLQNQWFWWKTRIWSDHELHLPTEYAGSYHLGRTCPEDWGTRCRARVSPLLSGQHHPAGGKSRSQVAEAEVIKVGLSWLCSRIYAVSLSQHVPLPPRSKWCWNKRG